MSLRDSRRQGFTLIELLVVIAIIGILAALIASVSINSTIKMRVAMARTELAQMESGINEYRGKVGSYPPDNPGDPALNPLYFELLGTTNNGDVYVTLDGSGQISSSTGEINSHFNRQGFFNTTPRARSTDEASAAISFLDNLRPKQIGNPDAAKPLIKILVCSLEWAGDPAAAPIPNTKLNPWRYVSTNPTNNTASYDLWVDLFMRGKTYRISNWSKEPQIF